MQSQAENWVKKALQAKILTQTEFIAKSLSFRKQNKKVVFTNGCFDLLHSGHISYLMQAKALGDFLFLALNSDASVKKLKGEMRPIFPLQERLENLAALFFVDYLTSFEQETPLSLIEQALPFLLVKGGDYQPSQIVGQKVVEKNNGQVLSLPFVDGRSTTALLAQFSKIEKK